MKENFVIGIIGGMGSYATVDFFRRIVEAFPAEKEWERPRILIDNFCTMPSRVRAILYNEKRDELIKDLSGSIINMKRAGVSKIILACNTSHVFLPEIEKKVPDCKGMFVHIINTLAAEMQLQRMKKSYLLASEGTIESGIYKDCFSQTGITLSVPSIEHYSLLREWIEAVKQNSIDSACLEKFKMFVDGCASESLILGCTELPILYKKALQTGWKAKVKVFDPLQSVIEVLKKEYYEHKNKV